MTGWAENLRAIAAGKYGPGEAARPARPPAAHPDPVESNEEIAAPPPQAPRRAESPRADARVAERAKLHDSPLAPPEGGGAHAPEAAGARPSRLLPSPAPRPAPRAEATPRAPAARAPADPGPQSAGEAAPAVPAFSSYDDARSVRFETPDFDAPEDLPPSELPAAPERADAGALRPERAEDGRGHEEVLAPPRQPEPQPRAQGPTLEIGELSISVLPPATGPTTTPAPAPRGTPISSSAALRRAGIRRL